MIYLRVVDVNIPPGVEVKSTTWEFGTSDSFEPDSIVFKSVDDEVRLFALYENIEVTENVTYYSRCRFLLSTGYTEWSNVEVGIVDSVSETEQMIRISAPIMAPEITLFFDDKSQPRSVIQASVELPKLVSNAVEAVTWIIEDRFGKVVWISEKDRHNINSIVIPTVLNIHDVYSIKAKLHTEAGNNSPFGVRPFYTSGDDDILKQYPLVIDDRSYGSDIEFKGYLSQNSNLEIEVYQVQEQIFSEITSNTTISFGQLLAQSTYEHNFFILRARELDNGVPITEWTYRFIRRGRREYVLPALFPYNLMHMFTWEPTEF